MTGVRSTSVQIVIAAMHVCGLKESYNPAPIASPTKHRPTTKEMTWLAKGLVSCGRGPEHGKNHGTEQEENSMSGRRVVLRRMPHKSISHSYMGFKNQLAKPKLE